QRIQLGAERAVSLFRESSGGVVAEETHAQRRRQIVAAGLVESFRELDEVALGQLVETDLHRLREGGVGRGGVVQHRVKRRQPKTRDRRRLGRRRAGEDRRGRGDVAPRFLGGRDQQLEVRRDRRVQLRGRGERVDVAARDRLTRDLMWRRRLRRRDRDPRRDDRRRRRRFAA